MTQAVNSVLTTSLLVEALKDDEDVTREIKALALKAIREADHLLTHSMPNVKVQVIKSIMPAVARALQVSSVDNELQTVKDDIRTMIQEMRAEKEQTPDDD